MYFPCFYLIFCLIITVRHKFDEKPRKADTKTVFLNQHWCWKNMVRPIFFRGPQCIICFNFSFFFPPSLAPSVCLSSERKTKITTVWKGKRSCVPGSPWAFLGGVNLEEKEIYSAGHCWWPREGEGEADYPILPAKFLGSKEKRRRGEQLRFSLLWKNGGKKLTTTSVHEKKRLAKESVNSQNSCDFFYLWKKSLLPPSDRG